MTCDKSGAIYVGVSWIGDTLFVGTYKIPFRNIAAQSALVKLDIAGNILWVKDLSTSGNPIVKTDKYNTVYLSGCFGTNTVDIDGDTITNLAPGGNTIFLAKMDALGNLQWLKREGNVPDEFINNSFTIDVEGNLYISGTYGGSSSVTFGSSTLPGYIVGSTLAYLTKFDSSGTAIWANWLAVKSVGRIVTDAQANVYITGSFDSLINLGSTTLTNSNHSTKDLYLIKFDKNGNVKWGRTIGGPGDERGIALAMGPYNNVWVLGKFNSSSITIATDVFNQPPAGTYPPSAPDPDPMFLTGYDVAGNIVCSKFIETSGIPGDITTDNTGYVYLTNSVVSDSSIGIPFGHDTIVNKNFSNVFIAKLQPCPILDVPGINATKQQVKVYPDPVTKIFYISNAKDCVYAIINMTGTQLQQGTVISTDQSIDISNYKEGIYFLQLVHADGYKEIIKLVKR